MFEDYLKSLYDNPLAQIIGIIAMIVAICSFQQRTQKRIVLFQFISSILFSTHPTPNSQIQQVSCISSSILPQPALWSHSFDEWAGDITWQESESLL